MGKKMTNSMSGDTFLGILAMDAYNQNYLAGLSENKPIIGVAERIDMGEIPNSWTSAIHRLMESPPAPS